MKKRVVVIGAGGRANSYLMYGAKEQYELVAVADPNQKNRKTFLGLNSMVGKVKEYNCFKKMLEELNDIDGAIICTPNHQHVEPAVECMRRGIVIALEKPIAENEESCRKILEAKRKYNGRVLVGFVLRSAPFYLKARQWIKEGRIGDITTIQADELPHVLTTSVMFRSDWRRFKKISGGAMNEKCCHDIDMLNWLISSQPVMLNSMAARKTLNEKPELPKSCDQCAITEKCPYYLPPEKYNHPDQIKKANDGLLYKFTRDNSACIYNNGHDLYDHQQVLVQYSNGVTASLTLDFSCKGKQCGRHIKIIGTEGVIWGKLEDNKINIHNKVSDTEETFDLHDDGSGHGGGNRKHADEFIKMIEDPTYQPHATVEDGFLSSMMCFAADYSAKEKITIDFTKIFGFFDGLCRKSVRNNISFRYVSAN